MALASSDPSPWWALRFEALAEMHPGFAEGVDDRSESEVAFVENLIDLGSGIRVMDVGCGAGRHSIPLGERGHQVTGVDLSPRLLRLARDRWDARNPGVRGPQWLPGDMRWLPACGPFDLAILLDGVLGFFDDDADALRTLTSVAERLRPGGHVVAQLPNPYHWSGRSRSVHVPAGVIGEGIDVLRATRFDPMRGRVEERTVVFKGGIRHEPPALSVRSWTPPELLALFRGAGFVTVSVSGSEGFAVPEEELPVHPTESVWLWVHAEL